MKDLRPERYKKVRLKKVDSRPLLLHEELSAQGEKAVLKFLDETSLQVDISGEYFCETELFDPAWKTLNSGSSRSVLAGKYQVKGVGVTLPVDKLDPVMQTGIISPERAIHSFMISKLQNHFLPLGSLEALAVLMTENNQALYIRKADSFRLAQLSPELTPEEKELVRSKLTILDPGLGGEKLMAQIMKQFATSVFYGGTIPTGADNLLIDGKLIDEEEVHWSLPGSWNLQFEMTYPDYVSGVSPDSLPEEVKETAKSFFNDLEEMIAKYIKAMSFLDLVTPDITTWKNSFFESFLHLWNDGARETLSDVERIFRFGGKHSSSQLLRYLSENNLSWSCRHTQRPGTYIFSFRLGKDVSRDLSPYNQSMKFLRLNTEFLNSHELMEYSEAAMKPFLAKKL